MGITTEPKFGSPEWYERYRQTQREENDRRDRMRPFLKQYERGILTADELLNKFLQYWDKP